MRCSKAGKHLSTYMDGELAPKAAAQLESHLAQCNRCSGELAQMRQLQGLFCQASRFSAPSAFRAEVLEKITGEPSKVFSFFPVFIRFAEAGVFVLAITAGVISGGMLINAVDPHHKGEQVIASLSLESFEALPPDSLGLAYLSMTEEKP